MIIFKKRILIAILFGATGFMVSCTDNREIEEATKGKTAELSFNIVSEASFRRGDAPGNIREPYPPGTIYYEFAFKEGPGLLVYKDTKITGDCIKSAVEGIHPVSNTMIVNFQFNDVCTKRFERLTTEKIGKQFAIVLNGEILSVVRINGTISRGRGYIGGYFSAQDARELAYMINRQNQ